MALCKGVLFEPVAASGIVFASDSMPSIEVSANPSTCEDVC